MQLHWRRNLGLALVGVVIVAAIAWGFRPPARSVDLATAVRAALQVTVDEEGKSRVIDRYVISAPVGGYMPRITYKVGDSVAQGDTVLALEPIRPAALDARSRAAAQAQVAAATAALRAAQEKVQAAQADAQQAQAEYQRLQGLRANQLISANDLDRARTQAETTEASRRSAEFGVQVSRYELESAKTALMYAGGGGKASDRIAITTPVAGRVLKLYQESEGIVAAGQPLLAVGDPQRLEIAVDLLSSDAVQIAPGMEVILRNWGGAPLQARVRLIEPVGFTKISALGVEEQRVTVIADLTSPAEQWRNLGDGYRVDASFVLWQGDDVLQIPESALFRDGARWQAFVVADGHAQLRNVQPGRRNGLQAQVLGGIAAGEQVVTHPDDKLYDGAPVAQR